MQMQRPRTHGILRAYAKAFAFWGGMSLLMGLQYKPPDRAHFWSSLIELLLLVAAHAFALTPWTPPIFYLVGKYLSYSVRRFRYVLLWGLGAIPFIVLYTGIYSLLVPPYDDALQRYTSRSFHAWFEVIRTGFADVLFIYVAIVVAAHAYEYLKRVRRQEAERLEYQQALAASELQALKMQLQPHFLFNTLHGIATLVDRDTNAARAMIIKLSNLLRTALDRDGTDLIPLDAELKFAHQYLDLEKMRFGSRLQVDWLIGSDTRGVLVPQMILQPLVENAIRHGIGPSREGGWLQVITSMRDEYLEITVRNSTCDSRSNGTGVGLRNVEARLRYLYSGDANLSFNLGADRTATTNLKLPALNYRVADSHRGRVDQVVA